MDFLNGLTNTINSVGHIAEGVQTLAPLLMGMGEDIKRLNARHAALLHHVAKLKAQHQTPVHDVVVDRKVQKARAKTSRAQARKNDAYTGGNYEVAGDYQVGGNYEVAGDYQVGGNYEIAGDEVVGGGKRRKAGGKKSHNSKVNLGAGIVDDILGLF